MRAIFRICGNESQPGLQIVDKLATPQVTDLLYTNVFISIINFYLSFFLILVIVIAVITITVFMTLVIRPLPAAICSPV